MPELYPVVMKPTSTIAFVLGLLVPGIAYASILSATVTYEAIEEIPIEESETLEEMALRIATRWNIDENILFNLVYYESRWDPHADNGHDRGLVQINRTYNPDVTDEQAFDPEFSLNFAAEAIAKGEASKWVVCNCYLYVKTYIKDIPSMMKIEPNIDVPSVGGIAIFDYEGIKHLAYITEVTEKGMEISEANYEPCVVGKRTIPLDDDALIGFWSPG